MFTDVQDRWIEVAAVSTVVGAAAIGLLYTLYLEFCYIANQRKRMKQFLEDMERFLQDTKHHLDKEGE